jgi:hypothetical protein
MDDNDDRKLWGAAAIGEFLELSERQAFHLLKQGAIPARKVGGRYLSTPRLLRQLIQPPSDAAA